MYFKPGIKESKKDFFDFKPELDALTRELRSMETRMVVIRGVRRTGKSSLLRIGLAESKLPHLLLDARTFGPFSPDQIYELMANSLSELIEKHRAIGEILRRVKGISIAGSRVDFVSRDRPVLVEVLEKLSEWGKSKGKPVVLALDEAQEFRLLPRFDSLLAHIYDYSMGIKLVLAGSEVGVLDEFLGRRKAKAPLFGRPYFEIRMERLPAERAEEFLTAGFEQLGKKVGAGEISGAVTLFDGIIGWLTSYGYYRSKTDHRKAVAKTYRERDEARQGGARVFLGPKASSKSEVYQRARNARITHELVRGKTGTERKTWANYKRQATEPLPH